MKKNRAVINWNTSWVFDFAIEIILLIAVFLLPTIFDRRLGIVFSGTKVAFMRALGVIVLSVWAIKLILTREHRFARTLLDWPVLSFLLCVTIATLTSVHAYTSFAGFYGRYEGLTSWYLFGLFFFVITNYIKSFDQIKRIIVTVASAATLMSVYSIIQRHELDPYMWGGVVTWQRVIGTIGQPNFLAAYMLMAFFLVLSFFLMERKALTAEIDWFDQLMPLAYFLVGQVTFVVMIYNLEANNVFLWYLGFAIVTASAVLFAYAYDKLHPWILNILLALVLLLTYICILYTQSRGGYMGLFTGGVLFALVASRRGLFASWKKISVLGLLIVVISGVTMLRPEYSPFERFATEITTEQVEAESRLELRGAAGSRGETWKSAFQIIADYPIFGIGPEVLKMVFPRYETELFRFKEAFHVKQDRCHSETFDVSVTKGLIAFFIYLWILFQVFRQGWIKAARSEGDHKLVLAGLLAAALAYLIQNQFSFGVVAITSLFWMIWGMVMVIGEKEEVIKPREFSWSDIPWLPVALVALLSLFLIYRSFISFRGDIWFKSGKTRLEMRQPEAAARDLEKSLKIFPYEGSTISHLGIAYLNLSRSGPERIKDVERAISVLRYGTQVDPYNADNFYMLAKIHLMLFDMGNREALVLARAYAESALKIDPYYAEVYHTLGLIDQREGKWDQAAQNFEKAFMINPNLVEPMQDLENLCLRTGRSSEILKVFEKALQRYGDNLIILERVARLYLERGENEKALDLSQRMIRIDPKFPFGYILRAEIRLRKGDVGSAFSDLQQVIMIDPKSVPAHNGLARIYLMQGDRQRAKEEFEQVLRIDPNNAYAKNMLEKLK